VGKKSKSYQYKIVEISFESAKLNNFSNERGMSRVLMDNSCDEKISDLKEELLDEIYEIVNGEFLTEHQKKILFMRLMGKTQNEIAEHLGITQSAVHKAMHGNIDYKNQKKRYGGIVKKLQKICKVHPRITEILAEIAKISKGEVE
jgi:predicted XRE-type DNA-binding protein|tara:strand:+ start:43 stop:480 length:438 start_codon:yes stop_codon:yes gene_type:complete